MPTVYGESGKLSTGVNSNRRVVNWNISKPSGLEMIKKKRKLLHSNNYLTFKRWSVFFGWRTPKCERRRSVRRLGNFKWLGTFRCFALNYAHCTCIFSIFLSICSPGLRLSAPFVWPVCLRAARRSSYSLCAHHECTFRGILRISVTVALEPFAAIRSHLLFSIFLPTPLLLFLAFPLSFSFACATNIIPLSSPLRQAGTLL